MKTELKSFGVLAVVAVFFLMVKCAYDYIHTKWGHDGYEASVAVLFGLIIFTFAFIVFKSDSDKKKRASKFLSEKKCAPCYYDHKKGIA